LIKGSNGWDREPPVRLLIALLVGVAVFFIPLALLLDSIWPGAHVGFQLLGVWALWVVPGTVALSIGTVIVARRSVASSRLSQAQFVAAALVIYATFFSACLFKYRGWFR